MTNTQQTPIEHMHDVSIGSHNGLWRLQQADGMNEYSLIDLHPIQIRLLAEQAGLLAAPFDGEKKQGAGIQAATQKEANEQLVLT